MTDRCFLDSNLLVYAHDRGSGEKHERAKDLVENFLDHALALGQRHGDAFIRHQPLHHRADLRPDALLIERPELLRIERVQKLAVNPALDFKPTIGARTGPDWCANTHEEPVYAVFVFTVCNFAPVALSTKARKILSCSPAAWRSATIGRALLTADSMTGECGIP